ncbi:MAG: pentapeptide repeat-containing protein, partial [Sphaerospermopsis sp. SIO1G2]|nr:pentapeptide repeat-containing protein [Sphaerospermopsis sp. SIO1G2]
MDRKEELLNTFEFDYKFERLYPIYSDFEIYEFLKSDFQGLYLQGRIFTQADLITWSFKEADLKQAIFKDTNLIQISFENANLEKAIFQGVNFLQSNFKNANFSQTTFEEVSFLEANLMYANFSKARINNTNFSRANLVRAKLTNSTLLGKCIFHQAFLIKADLNYANFQGAYLTEANLTMMTALGTDFQNADFTGACIKQIACDDQTNLSEVVCRYIYLEPLNDLPITINFQETSEFLIRLRLVITTLKINIEQGYDEVEKILNLLENLLEYHNQSRLERKMNRFTLSS